MTDRVGQCVLLSFGFGSLLGRRLFAGLIVVLGLDVVIVDGHCLLDLVLEGRLIVGAGYD